MGHFSDEWETRFEELCDTIEECIEHGGDPKADMPDTWAEYEGMELVYQTEFF